MLPTSRPRVGWSSDEQLRGRSNSRATTTFCWLPPDSVPAWTVADGVRMSNSAMFSSASSRSRRRCGCRARERRAHVAVEHEVVGDREREDQAEAMAVGGNVARRRARATCARTAPVTFVAVERDRARADRGAGRRSPRRARPGRCPATPAMPRISPARTSSDDAVDGLVAAVVLDAAGRCMSSTRPAGVDSPRSTVSWTSRPTISSARSSSVVSLRHGARRRPCRGA